MGSRPVGSKGEYPPNFCGLSPRGRPHLAGAVRTRHKRADEPRELTLAANPEALDQRAIARLIVTLEKVEQLPPLRDELEQAAPGMVILHVRLEVLGQVGDAFRKDRYLNFRRAGIGLGRRVFLDERLLALGC